MRDQWDHFIDGVWRTPKGGRYLDSTNPASGEHVTRIAAGTAEDVATAVAASRAAYGEWRRMKALERGRLLVDIGRAIRASVGPILPPAPSTTRSPSSPASTSTTSVVGRESTSSSCVSVSIIR